MFDNQFTPYQILQMESWTPPGYGLGEAFPTIVNSSEYYTATATTSHTSVTLPASLVSGNLLLGFFSIARGGGGTLTISGWTQISVFGSTPDEFYIMGKISDGTEGSTITVTLGASNRIASVIYQINGNRNGLTTSEVSATGTSTVVDPPSHTPSWGSAKNLWFCGYGTGSNANATGITAPANYGNLIVTNGGAGSDEEVVVADRAYEASSDDPATFTGTGLGGSAAFTLAVRPL